jgi:hypothetical protein
MKDLDKIAYKFYQEEEKKKWNVGYFTYSIEFFIEDEKGIFKKYTMTKTKLKTSEAKTSSSYQKEINRLKKLCSKLHVDLQYRNLYIRQTSIFMKDMLSQGKISKDDLIPYFKRKDENLK